MSSQPTRDLVQFVDIPVQLLNAETKEIVSYLKESHFRYQNEEIPRIEQQFLGLIKLFPNSPALVAVFQLFQKFQLEMQWHMKHEEQVLYPQALSKKKEENTHLVSHEDQEPFLKEVIQLMESSNYAKNPFGRMLIHRLRRFEEDLRMHAWVEEHLLSL